MSKQIKNILILAASGIVVMSAFNNCAQDLDEDLIAQQSLNSGALNLRASNYQVQSGQSTALIVNGGTAPYTYEVTPTGNGVVDSSAYFLASATGVTTIKVIDAEGKIKEISVTVVDPPAPPPAGCTAPFGAAIAHAGSLVAWNVAVGAACTSETRVCTNGNLSGTFIHASCRVGATCRTPWGATIAHGAAVTAYFSSTVCLSQRRTCNDGVLSGSYSAQTCQERN